MHLFSLLAEVAEAVEVRSFHLPEDFWPGFLAALIYSVFGLVLALFGFKLFDWILPKVDVQEELAKNRNVAVAIVCAAVILGSFYLVSVAIK